MASIMNRDGIREVMITTRTRAAINKSVVSYDICGGHAGADCSLVRTEGPSDQPDTFFFFFL
jgi:hypothetical protein